MQFTRNNDEQQWWHTTGCCYCRCRRCVVGQVLWCCHISPKALPDSLELVLDVTIMQHVVVRNNKQMKQVESDPAYFFVCKISSIISRMWLPMHCVALSHRRHHSFLISGWQTAGCSWCMSYIFEKMYMLLIHYLKCSWCDQQGHKRLCDALPLPRHKLDMLKSSCSWEYNS